MFRLQKYKKFESNSQPIETQDGVATCCFDCKSTKNLRAIHNEALRDSDGYELFRLQKYKKFESNSQLEDAKETFRQGCFDCKSTKNLRAIHNQVTFHNRLVALFRLQKYKKFESNSQPTARRSDHYGSCFDCKSTKNLRAIHNSPDWLLLDQGVVSTAKVQKI